MEPSDAVKRRNDYQTEGRRPTRSAGLRPQLEVWLGLAWPWVSLLRSTPMKMELPVSSETSALKAQMTGDYPIDTIRHSTHGESFKSIICLPFYLSVIQTDEIRTGCSWIISPHCTSVHRYFIRILTLLMPFLNSSNKLQDIYVLAFYNFTYSICEMHVILSVVRSYSLQQQVTFRLGYERCKYLPVCILFYCATKEIYCTALLHVTPYRLQ